MQIIEAIARNNYLATEAQVEALAATAQIGRAADSTYLRVLVAAVQSALGAPKRGRKPAQAPVIDREHERLYAAVLRGVGPEDTDKAERSRRATFARTAASTLRGFVRSGGDVRALVVAEVGKSALRQAHAPVREGTRDVRIVHHAQASMVRALARMAKTNGLQARKQLAEVIDSLQESLEVMEAEKPARSSAMQHRKGRTPATSERPAASGVRAAH